MCNEGPGLESYDSGVLPLFTTELPHHGECLPRRSRLPVSAEDHAVLRPVPRLRQAGQHHDRQESDVSICPARFPSISASFGTRPAPRLAPLRSRPPRRICKPRLQRNHVLFADRASADFHAHRAFQLSIHAISRIWKCPARWATAPATTRSPDFSEVLTGLTTRTDTRGSTNGGPAIAKRVSVNADWAGIYQSPTNFGSTIPFATTTGAFPGLWDASGRKPVLSRGRGLSRRCCCRS